MGNWRRVQIIGTCGIEDLPELEKALSPGSEYLNFHCLSLTSGICGVPDWAMPEFNVVGNLAERDFVVDDVEAELAKIAEACPSINCLIHIGDDGESDNCIATVRAVGGRVMTKAPEVDCLPEITEEQMQKKMAAAIGL